jgi:oxygen-independent coproporphyrinogen-3 oxidase
MHRRGVLRDVVEFTVEANPETVSDELLAVLVAGGANRISIGSQTSHADLLKTLERWHDPRNVVEAVKCARRAGIDNINLDTIFAIPGQTLAMLEADLDFILSQQPDHVSFYNLTYEPNTAMTERLRQGAFEPVEESLERDMFALVIDRLAAAGYEQYEISNWAKPGRRCEHNLLYWQNANWLGIGPSAASHVDGRRWKNAPHLGRYLAQGDVPIVDDETLPADDRLGERLMMGLRLLEGVPTNVVPDDNARQATIDELISIGMLERTGDRLRLTRRGLFVADMVFAKLL